MFKILTRDQILLLIIIVFVSEIDLRNCHGRKGSMGFGVLFVEVYAIGYLYLDK